MSVRRRVLPIFLASLAASLLMTAPAQAQLQVATIRGVVLDASDLVIPGVTIDLTDPLGSAVARGASRLLTPIEGESRKTRCRLVAG